MARKLLRHNAVTGVSETVELTPEQEAKIEAEEARYNAKAPDRAFELLRMERNKKLAETDYLGMPDREMTDEMKTYRQALRDLPAQYTDETIVSEEITWPTKPA